MIAALVFFGLFILVSIIHLVFCFIENEKFRRITKPACLALLAIAAILYNPTNPFIYIGAFVCMVADIFLIFKDDMKWLLIGTGCFFVGHVFYMIALTNALPFQFPWWAYILQFSVPAMMMFILFPLTERLGFASLIGNFYMVYLLFMIILGIVYIVNVPWNLTAGILFLVGYLTFFASDVLIIVFKFKRYPVRRSHFYIMITYLVAQALIVCALCFASAGFPVFF